MVLFAQFLIYGHFGYRNRVKSKNTTFLHPKLAIDQLKSKKIPMRQIAKLLWLSRWAVQGSIALSAQALFDIAAQHSDPLPPLRAISLLDVSSQRSDLILDRCSVLHHLDQGSLFFFFFFRNRPWKFRKIGRNWKNVALSTPIHISSSA